MSTGCFEEGAAGFVVPCLPPLDPWEWEPEDDPGLEPGLDPEAVPADALELLAVVSLSGVGAALAVVGGAACVPSADEGHPLGVPPPEAVVGAGAGAVSVAVGGGVAEAAADVAAGVGAEDAAAVLDEAVAESAVFAPPFRRNAYQPIIRHTVMSASPAAMYVSTGVPLGTGTVASSTVLRDSGVGVACPGAAPFIGGAPIGATDGGPAGPGVDSIGGGA
jgi:hypothetical protein